jgi:predicted transcriptional regulator
MIYHTVIFINVFDLNIYMRTFFEIMAQDILPSFRAIVAKRLIESGFSQKQIADRLGLSQPAISQYKRDLRGKRNDVFSENPRLHEEINTIAGRVASGEINVDQATMDAFEVCRGFFEIK